MDGGSKIVWHGWSLRGNDFGSGSVCFDFRSTNIVQLSNRKYVVNGCLLTVDDSSSWTRTDVITHESPILDHTSFIQIENYIAALAHSCAPLHTLVNSTTFEASNFKFSAFCHDHDSINETQRLIFHTVTGHCNLHAPLTTPTTADFYQNT